MTIPAAAILATAPQVGAISYRVGVVVKGAPDAHPASAGEVGRAAAPPPSGAAVVPDSQDRPRSLRAGGRRDHVFATSEAPCSSPRLRRTSHAAGDGQARGWTGTSTGWTTAGAAARRDGSADDPARAPRYAQRPRRQAPPARRRHDHSCAAWCPDPRPVRGPHRAPRRARRPHSVGARRPVVVRRPPDRARRRRRTPDGRDPSGAPAHPGLRSWHSPSRQAGQIMVVAAPPPPAPTRTACPSRGTSSSRW
jgi:hypothetical protein